MEEISISSIHDFNIGNAQNNESGTGCTVILCKEGAVGGVDVRGGAPGTRETDLLSPMNLVEKINGVILTGGSAFGLDAASGVMKYLEERGFGFDVGVTKVPIVCGAALFDLTVGNHKIRPDTKMGYEACLFSEKFAISQGNFGAGTGATVGKLLGKERSCKGGLGNYGLRVGELMVGAVVAVNCLGNVIDPIKGETIGGIINEKGNGFLSTEELMIQHYDNEKNLFAGNTTIGTIITNASLSKSGANKVASMSHNGLARTIYPVHTMYDGDTIFAMASGKVKADINVVGTLATMALQNAVINAIKYAEDSFGILSYKSILRNSLCQ